MYRFTKHAEERWRERVRTPLPTGEELDRLIAEAVQIQECKQVYTPRGRSMMIMGAWWHPETGVVLRTNDRVQKVVTVFTKEIRCERKRARR